MRTVGIYARVSTDKQENGNQLDQLREFAAKQGWEIVAEYVDTVTGSGKLKRPQFDKMMRELKPYIVLWEASRKGEAVAAVAN